MNSNNKNNVKKRSALKFALQTGVSVIALSWVFLSLRNIDWQISMLHFSNLSIGRLIACFLLVLGIYASRLVRLRYLVMNMPAASLSAGEWLDLYLKSIALGSITPARIGDFSRITLLAKTGLSLRDRSKVVLFDRLADIFYIPAGICLTAGIVGEKFAIPESWLLGSGLAIGLVFLALGFWFGRFLGLRVLLVGGALTVLGFIFFIHSNALLFWAVGIKLTLMEIAAIIISVGVLANLPVSVGGLGIREGSLVSLLSLWGVSTNSMPPLLLLELILNMIFPVVLYFVWLYFQKNTQKREKDNQSTQLG